MVLALSVPFPALPALAVLATAGTLYHLWLRQRATLGKSVYVHLLRLAAIVALGWALGCAVVFLLARLLPAP